MDDLSIRTLSHGDEHTLDLLLHLYISVFGEPGYPENTDHLSPLLQNESVLFVVALMSEKLVGGVTGYLLPSLYGGYHELYIYDMAVSIDFQHRGIGSRLLDYLKAYCKSAGVHEMYVQADAPDLEARQFYKKNDGTESDVFQYNFRI